MNNEEPTEIDLAAHSYQQAKAAEDTARLARLAAEERLIALIGCKEEGSTSRKTAYYKVATTGKLTRTLIADRVQEAATALGELIDTVIQWKPALSLSGLRALEKANPEAYAAMCKAIVTKPAKPAVKVELIQRKEEDK